MAATSEDLRVRATRDNGERAVIDRLRQEVDGYLRDLQEFSGMEPDQVLLKLSAIGARLIEIRTHLIRNEGRFAMGFRTKELDPLLAHLEFQHKVHSRLHATREFDLKLSGGAPG